MKAINKSAQKVLEALVAGLEPGSSKKFDNAKGVYMALSVERLSEDRFSIAHYFEANGDLVADPDMEFWKGPDGRFYPVAIQMSTGHYQQAIQFGDDGKPKGYAPKAQAEQASFAASWLRNVKSQQGVGKAES